MDANFTHPFTLGNVSLDVTSLPDVSIHALLSRGLTHFFGSEAASRVKARVDKIEEETGAPAGDDERAAIKAEVLADFVAKLREGTIGSRLAAIAVDPIDKVKAQLARKQVEDTLRANGIKVPKKDEAVQFDNGDTFTMVELVARKLARNGEAIEKEAAKIVRDQAAKKAAAEKAAVGVETKTADALGL